MTACSAGGLSVCGLFAGVGGIELGLLRSGHTIRLLCEIDPAAQAVLRYRFPGVPLVDDVHSLDDLGGFDLVAAGFPCQDLSQVGRTAGIAGPNSGLVVRLFDLLERTPEPERPVWILLENVPFMLHLRRGEAIRLIVERLESLGYVWAYRVVDARAFGLPQRRRRVFLLAAREGAGDPRDVLLADDAGAEPADGDRPAAAAWGFYWTEGNRGTGLAPDAVPPLKGGSGLRIPSPPAVWETATGRIFTPDVRDAERLQGFPAGWTAPASETAGDRVRWRLVGNAVTVPVAGWIGGRLRRPGRFEGGCTPLLQAGGRWPYAAWGARGERWSVRVSDRPHRFVQPRILDFLDHRGEDLSRRAASGFLSRALASGLRFPDGFLAALWRHTGADAPPRSDGRRGVAVVAP